MIACIARYDPVCGNDGQTYSKSVGIQILIKSGHEKICPFCHIQTISTQISLHILSIYTFVVCYLNRTILFASLINESPILYAGLC